MCNWGVWVAPPSGAERYRARMDRSACIQDFIITFWFCSTLTFLKTILLDYIFPCLVSSSRLLFLPVLFNFSLHSLPRSHIYLTAYGPGLRLKEGGRETPNLAGLSSRFIPCATPTPHPHHPSHSLLQGIFPTQRLNPFLLHCPLHCRQILYH